MCSVFRDASPAVMMAKSVATVNDGIRLAIQTISEGRPNAILLKYTEEAPWWLLQLLNATIQRLSASKDGKHGVGTADTAREPIKAARERIKTARAHIVRLRNYEYLGMRSSHTPADTQWWAGIISRATSEQSMTETITETLTKMKKALSPRENRLQHERLIEQGAILREFFQAIKDPASHPPRMSLEDITKQFRSELVGDLQETYARHLAKELARRENPTLAATKNKDVTEAIKFEAAFMELLSASLAFLINRTKVIEDDGYDGRVKDARKRLDSLLGDDTGDSHSEPNVIKWQFILQSLLRAERRLGDDTGDSHSELNVVKWNTALNHLQKGDDIRSFNMSLDDTGSAVLNDMHDHWFIFNAVLDLWEFFRDDWRNNHATFSPQSTS
eukprot:GHVU01130212.1.p1 GENE.GHVU01130212.1~~GHVU01130212.1.p1  ORF type:complete len:389 (+),score=40.17 GHVU01130212.1:1618-2784(+)